MICPKCRKKYKWLLLTCPDCGIPLKCELNEKAAPRKTKRADYKYVNYVPLYSPVNESEALLLKSILDSARIRYFVKNDNFGSLEVGPYIGLFNAKMILVQEDQYKRAGNLLANYFEKTRKATGKAIEKYSLFDKIRMFLEVAVFGWLMPGRIRAKHHN